jgi:ATP-dependent RNA helicase DeaD
MQNFNELNISAEVMRALTELGYTAPTPIQAETLPLLLSGDTDFLGLAATGTGKTAAFGIPLLERIDRDTRGVQALILCPTRELAIQVAGQIDLLGKYIGIRSLPVYGGTGYRDQIDGLRNGAQIVVGTPGRVVDHIEKGTLRLDALKTLVLDEADEMISMGFQEDLEKVLKGAPKDQANIWLFSATMGHDVKHVADAYLTEPKRVQINKTEMLSANVEQIFYKTHEYDKPELLCKVIDVAEDFYGIVFCQTKALVADLNSFLLGKGYRVDCLHGDLDQAARDRVMKAFRDRKIQILIATDVACRGLDVKDVTHVVNYSIPRELDNYVHRIGRTARSGKSGIAISFVTFSHRELIGRIERMTKSKMLEGTPPTAKDIAMKRITKVRTAFEAQGPQGRASAVIPSDWKESLATLEKEDIVGRFLNLMMPDMFTVQEKAPAKSLEDSRPAVRAEKTGERAPRARSSAGSYGGDRPRFNPAGPGKPFRGGDKPAYGDKPRYGSKPTFGGDKPRFDSKPRYGSKPTFSKGKPFPGQENAAPAAGPSEAPRFEKPKYEGKPSYGGKPSFGDKPRFGGKPSFGSKPAYGKKPFSAREESAPSQSRWKNNFSNGPGRTNAPLPGAPMDETAAAIARDSQLGVGGEAKLKKKKPYGTWKPKKDKSVE